MARIVTNVEACDAAAREQTRRLEEHGRPASEAKYTPLPSVTCTHCKGRGCYVENHGGTMRRAFDAKRFDPQCERYVATCPECRGAGKKFVSAEEAASVARVTYAKIRIQVYIERGITHEDFDSIVRRRVREEKNPAAWLAAARDVAADFGVES